MNLLDLLMNRFQRIELVDSKPIPVVLPPEVPEGVRWETVHEPPETVFMSPHGKVQVRRFYTSWRDQDGNKVGIHIDLHYKIRRYWLDRWTGKTTESIASRRAEAVK